MDIAEEKQAQRTSGKAARRALSPEQRAAANAALCARLWQLDAVQNAQTILAAGGLWGEAGLAGFAAEGFAGARCRAYPVRRRKTVSPPPCPARTAGRQGCTASARRYWNGRCCWNRNS